MVLITQILFATPLATIPSATSAPPLSWGILGFMAMFLIGLLGFQFLNHRRKLKEMRLKTLENLARQGKIGREDIDKALGHQGGVETPVVVLSWISFLVSLFFVAILSTPFLLRELRRTQEP
jgi:hypothetical protein